jgi:hypothetical protein
MWAIGSIFGVTSTVDMKFTMRYGRPRMKVAVINTDLIPEFVDIVIGDFVYELQLRVEEGDENNPYQLTLMSSQKKMETKIKRRIQKRQTKKMMQKILEMLTQGKKN